MTTVAPQFASPVDHETYGFTLLRQAVDMP